MAALASKPGDMRAQLAEASKVLKRTRRIIQKPITDRIDKGYRSDLTSRFISLMEEKGFILLNKEGSDHYKTYRAELDYLLDSGKGEMLFKRKDGSNFFVFAKKEKGGIKIHFTNPDTSEKAWELKREAIVKTFVVFSEKGMESAVGEVVETSGKKGARTLFTNMHSHLGYLNVGLVRGNGVRMKHVADDGVSSDRDLIRNLLIANYDIDASGYHNVFNIEDFRAISRLEEAVGVRKIASLELTLPVEDTTQPLGFRNGAHHMVYFATPEDGERFHEQFLVPKSRELPGEAPDNVWYWKTLKDMKKWVDEGKLAIGLAHPAGRLTSIVKGAFVACGALNIVEIGKLRLADLIRNIQEFSMAVANFNLTIKPANMNPVSDKVRRRFRIWIRSAFELGRNADDLIVLTEPNVNYAFGQAMRGEGVLVYAETDKHHFHAMKYKSGVSAFRRAITVITTDASTSEITGEWFVNGMLSKNASFKMESVVFAVPVRKKDGIHLEIIREMNNTFEEKISDFFAAMGQGIHGGKHIISELAKAGWRAIFGKKEETKPQQ